MEFILEKFEPTPIVTIKTKFSSYQVFAERYSLKFVTISESEKDDGSVVMADEDDEDEDEDSDVYENALEELEIDDSHELYQTIVAAIIEESDQHAKDVFEEEKNMKDASNENGQESSDSNGIGWEDLGSEMPKK